MSRIVIDLETMRAVKTEAPIKWIDKFLTERMEKGEEIWDPTGGRLTSKNLIGFIFGAQPEALSTLCIIVVPENEFGTIGVALPFDSGDRAYYPVPWNKGDTYIDSDADVWGIETPATLDVVVRIRAIIQD